MNGIFTNIGYLQKALDGTWQRDEIISHNISNIDTPNYKKQGVSFESQLQAIIEGEGFKGRKTRERHMDIGLSSDQNFQPSTYIVNDTNMREDGNNVDIDTEMVNQAKNTIAYLYLAEKTNQNLRRIKNVINEGRR